MSDATVDALNMTAKPHSAVVVRITPTGNLDGLEPFQCRFVAPKEVVWFGSFVKSRVTPRVNENSALIFRGKDGVDVDIGDVVESLNSTRHGTLLAEDPVLSSCYDVATKVVDLELDCVNPVAVKRTPGSSSRSARAVVAAGNSAGLEVRGS